MTKDALLNSAIDKAATTKTDADYQSVFSLLEDQEVFFSIAHVDPARTTPMQVPLAKVGNGIRAVVFYISRQDGRLTEPHGGMPWKRALEMVLKIPDADGLLVQNLADAWISLKKEKVRELLQKYHY